MKTGADTYLDRMKKRSLPELLVHKFLTEYGYDHGPVIARAIVDDILATINHCCPERLPPKTVVWLAVRREWHGHRKSIELTDLVPVHLPVVKDNEIQLLMKPQLRKKHKARRAFNRARFARWCFEAYDQGGVLTLLDLSMLSGMSQQYVAVLLREHEAEFGKVVPTRGTVHDLGPSVTHKGEVVRRWLRNESPVQIARVLGHSQGAVDRYIADFQKVRLLVQKFPAADLPTLAGLSASVVKQYIALLRQYEPGLALYPESEPASASSDGIPVSSHASSTATNADRGKDEYPAPLELAMEQTAC